MVFSMRFRSNNRTKGSGGDNTCARRGSTSSHGVTDQDNSHSHDHTANQQQRQQGAEDKKAESSAGVVVEIMGIELLEYDGRNNCSRIEDYMADYYSYDSYANDSHAMAKGGKGGNEGRTKHRRYIHPRQQPRALSVCSSLGESSAIMDHHNSSNINFNEHTVPRRSSLGSFANDSYGKHRSGSMYRKPRRSSVGSFSNDSVDFGRYKMKSEGKTRAKDSAADYSSSAHAAPRKVGFGRRGSTGGAFAVARSLFRRGSVGSFAATNCESMITDHCVVGGGGGGGRTANNRLPFGRNTSVRSFVTGRRASMGGAFGRDSHDDHCTGRIGRVAGNYHQRVSSRRSSMGGVLGGVRQHSRRSINSSGTHGNSNNNDTDYGYGRGYGGGAVAAAAARRARRASLDSFANDSIDYGYGRGPGGGAGAAGTAATRRSRRSSIDSYANDSVDYGRERRGSGSVSQRGQRQRFPSIDSYANDSVEFGRMKGASAANQAQRNQNCRHFSSTGSVVSSNASASKNGGGGVDAKRRFSETSAGSFSKDVYDTQSIIGGASRAA